MKPESRSIRTRVSAVLLRSAALAFVLIAQTSPAHAETLTLACESTAEGSGSALYKSPVKFRIDLDNRTIDLLTPAGSVITSTKSRSMNALAPVVQISDSVIAWNLSNSIGIIFKGSIDRETGNTDITWFGPRVIDAYLFQGRCRRATQKF